jgi:hypothetical protein
MFNLKKRVLNDDEKSRAEKEKEFLNILCNEAIANAERMAQDRTNIRKHRLAIKKLEKESNTGFRTLDMPRNLLIKTFRELDDKITSEERTEKNFENRITRANGTIESTYHGDVDELIKTLKENITSITCKCEIGKEYQFKIYEEAFPSVNFTSSDGRQDSPVFKMFLSKEIKTSPIYNELKDWKAPGNLGAESGGAGITGEKKIYNSDTNTINNNLIIIDYLMNYQ